MRILAMVASILLTVDSGRLVFAFNTGLNTRAKNIDTLNWRFLRTSEIENVEDQEQKNLKEGVTNLPTRTTSTEGSYIPTKNFLRADEEERMFNKIATQHFIESDSVRMFHEFDVHGHHFLTNLDTISERIAKYNEEHPTSQTTLIKALVTHYGDKHVALSLQQVIKLVTDETTVNRAKALQSEQLLNWLDERKSPKSIANLLHLKDDNDIDRPTEVVFARYINLLCSKRPNSECFLTKATEALGETKLVQTLFSSPVLKLELPELKLELLSSWISQVVEPSQVFKKLELDDVANKIFTEEDRSNFMLEYLSRFNSRYSRDTTLLQVLQEYFPDDIIAERSHYWKVRGNQFAEELLKQLLQKWKDSDKSVNQVFHLLQFSDDMLNAFAKVEVLNNYIALIHSTNSPEALLLNVLRTGFKSESKVASALHSALRNNFVSPEIMTVQRAQFEEWFMSGIKTEKIFNMETDRFAVEITQEYDQFVTNLLENVRVVP